MSRAAPIQATLKTRNWASGRKVRKIEPGHLREIATSINSFGFCDPVLIDEQDEVLNVRFRHEIARGQNVTERLSMNPNRDLSNQRSNEREAMNPSENYQVGYGRPPMHTRWRKGQTGNPKRNRKRAPPPVFLMIEAFFAGEIEIVENGISRRVSNFEAVILQLWLKAMAGNKHAMNVLLKYKVAEDITREELLGGKK